MNIATKGHNLPSETPFDKAAARIDLLHLEATNWLDGEPIDSQAQADAVSKLLDEARKAKKEADDARKTEAKPFDDGKAEVQARYNPLLKQADTIGDVCKKVLAPFLAKVEAEKREVERIAREKANAAAEAALKAHQAAAATDLAAREKAEAMLVEAKTLEAAANRAEKDKGAAKGGARAVTLRSVWTATISDNTAFARYVWQNHTNDMVEFLEGYASQLVRNGARDLPGVIVTEEKRAQ